MNGAKNKKAKRNMFLFAGTQLYSGTEKEVNIGRAGKLDKVKTDKTFPQRKRKIAHGPLSGCHLIVSWAGAYSCTCDVPRVISASAMSASLLHQSVPAAT